MLTSKSLPAIYYQKILLNTQQSVKAKSKKEAVKRSTLLKSLLPSNVNIPKAASSKKPYQSLNTVGEKDFTKIAHVITK